MQIPIRGTLEFGQYVLGGLRDHPLWQLERTLLARCFGPAAPDKPKESQEPWPNHAVTFMIAKDLKAAMDKYRSAVVRENFEREANQIPPSQGLCETTLTERFRLDGCVCETYSGNLGPCTTYELGGNGRCVYCDHTAECHKQLASERTKTIGDIISGSTE